MQNQATALCEPSVTRLLAWDRQVESNKPYLPSVVRHEQRRTSRRVSTVLCAVRGGWQPRARGAEVRVVASPAGAWTPT